MHYKETKVDIGLGQYVDNTLIAKFVAYCYTVTGHSRRISSNTDLGRTSREHHFDRQIIVCKRKIPVSVEVFDSTECPLDVAMQ